MSLVNSINFKDSVYIYSNNVKIVTNIYICIYIYCETHTDLDNHLQQLPVAAFCPSDSTSRRPCPLVLALPDCSFFGSFLAVKKKKKLTIKLGYCVFC